MTPLDTLRAPYLPPFSWSRQRGTIIAIAVFAATMISLQLITGQGIAYFDISSISASAATLALAALGETIVILAGGLDLSAGAVISLVNVVLVTQLGPAAEMGTGLFTLVALVIALGLGAAIGAVNGFLVAYVRLQSIVVTLATMFIAQGAALLVLKFPGGEMPWDFSLVFTGDVITEGLPAPVVVLMVAVLFWLLLKNTRIGTGIYAIGSDAESAEANGVDVRRTRFLTFTFAGMCYGAAGLFITANMGGGDPLIGAKMLLQIFAAVVLGGTLIGGGRGGAVGTIFGALTLTVVVNIFLVLGVRTYYTPIVEGMILLIAVLGFSLGRDSPVVEIARFWRATLRALQESSLPSRLRIVGEPIRLGGPAPPAGGATAAAPWIDRHRAVLRFAVPAYFIYIVILGTTVGIFGSDFSPLAYLNAMLILTAFLAILGLGQGTVIITGGLDLSVPWTMTFPAIVVTTLCNGMDAPAAWVIPAALGIGIAIGFLNGMTIVLFGLSPIIVTLAMNGILEGVSLLFSSGAPIGKAPPALAWFVTGRTAGIAPIGWFLMGFVVVATLYLNRSAPGRRIFAVGNSERVSRLSGVRIGFPIVGAYVLSGFCSSLVGVFLAGFSAQAFYGMGDPYLLSSIAVVVLGGTLITGGRGHYLGILGGAILFTGLGIMLSGTVLPEAVRNIIYGVVLLGAIVALRERADT